MADGANQLFDPEAPPGIAPGEEAAAAAAQPGRPDVLSIGGLYDEIEGALTASFPRTRQLWVRGEIHSLSDHRSGHLYLDLVDPDHGGVGGTAGVRGRGVPTLHVKCWRTNWAPLRHRLAKEGITLAEGMVVELRGTLDVYRAKGEVSLILAEVDVTALLGHLAAQRARLLRALEAEGLLRRNSGLAVPELPLAVGLVASPGTEGYHDFLGQLQGSGFAFRVSVVKVRVQGPDAAAGVARALRMLSRSGCDLIALVRGGGARGDLAAFDTELVARAVAGSDVPVWTGIGHTGDETVADVVANRVCITPTECGQAIAQRVGAWWAARVAGPAGRLGQRVPSFLQDAEARDAAARRHLVAAARHQLRYHRGHLAGRVDGLGRSAPVRLEALEAGVRAQAARLGPLALGHLGRRDERVDGWRRLLAAYDVERQLERGYTLTLGPDGALIRSAADVAPDVVIVTRFADGRAQSRVEAIEMTEKRQES
jgi:exodeoxyribonuclease VII large subunit